MNILDFTVEEINLIAIYRVDGDSRAEVTARIAAALPDMDGDMREIAESATRKLNAMSAEEYAAATFDPADDTTDEDTDAGGWGW